MTGDESESKIVCGLRDGDRAAWDALCLKFGERLWKYISRLIGNDQAAVADVFQETLMAVARSGRTIAIDTKLWPWLARIGHNQASLHWRTHYRICRPTGGDTLDEQTTGECDDPATAMTQEETNASIRCLLAEMDADQVALLCGKYVDGMSVAQLVEIHGGTTESVRSRLARARRDFRERYERVASQS